MRFASPEILWWILLIPTFWFVSSFISRRRQKVMLATFGETPSKFLTQSVSLRKWRLKHLLWSFAFLFFILALARPQSGQTKQKVTNEGVEMMFVVDVSNSMMAEDIRPNRLEQVKLDLSRLLDLMPSNKVGVVAFAGSAALLSPMTNDLNALKMYLDSLSPQAVSSQGTNISEALKAAQEAFERGGTTADNVTRVTRVILLASDGEDQVEQDLKLAQELKSKGTTVFSLAYGTEKGAPIPERDQFNFLRGYKRDRSGQTVLSTVKGEFLKKIAESGGGSFYFASVGGNHLQKLIEDMGTLEKSQFESEMAVQYEENFQIFLIIGLIFAFAEIFVGTRSRVRKIWRGRFEVSA